MHGLLRRVPAPSFQTRRVFVAIAPGLEPVLQAELSDLGLTSEARPGGVQLTTDLAGLCAIHRWSRCAGRVTVEVGSCRATSLEELARGVRAMPWRDFVHPFQPIEVRVTTSGTRLHFPATLSKKVATGIADALKGPRIPGDRPPREAADVLLRIEGDRAHLSADASGELLHRRGWRLATAKAPLRENLAAAVLRLAGWGPDEALVDPMCGSGTFAIEAAGIAMGHAPGKGREFAFLRWPSVDKRVWDDPGAWTKPPLGAPRPILAGDRDTGAIDATQQNAKRAGVANRIRVEHASFADLEPPATEGLVVMNPPWGGRIGGQDPIGAYRGIGQVLRERWPGWRVALLTPEARLAGATGLAFAQITQFPSGGTRVGVWAYEP